MSFFRPTGALWRHAGFMRLWAAQTVSSFGARITREGLALASVLTIDAKPWQLGILAALALGPGLIVGMVAGGFVDRSRKRHIMIGADLARTAVLATVPVAAWLHILSMNQLYVVALAMGGLSVLFNIADRAYLPHLIAREHLMEGNTKLSTTDSLAEIGGPALAGSLVQLLTAPFAIAVNAGTYLFSAIFLFAIREREDLGGEHNKRATMLGDLRAGFAAYLDNPLLRPLMLMAGLNPMFGGVFSALYIVYAIRTLHLPPWLLGLIIGVGGVASLIGTWMAPLLVRRFGIGRTIVYGYLIAGLSAVCVPIAHAPTWFAVAMLTTAQLFGDSFAVAGMIPSSSLQQSVIPRGLLGRAGAAMSVASSAPAVIGALLGGAAGSLLNPRLALFIAATGIALTPLLGVFSRLPSLRDIPAPGPETAPAPGPLREGDPPPGAPEVPETP
ncbi:MAG: MFS transporter [Alphaproteobacteria bacterium]|nr:MFS transporter [Alphaproteobacteria bacterium]